MKIAVVSMRGGAGGGGLAAEFDASGGSIGRATSNLLVLDDPDRTVSRVHAQVLCRNDAFFIVDRGSNPLSHNGLTLGWGNEAPLTDGDRLQIGSFELAVSQAGAAASTALLDDLPTGALVQHPAESDNADDPFADLLAGLTPVSAPVAAKPVGRSATAPSVSTFFPDPMGLDTPDLKTGKADPFDDLMGFGGGGGGAAGAPFSGGGAFEGLPDASSSSIDELFGLGPSTHGGDPLALSPLANPLFQPNTASSADPLQALLGSGPKATAASRSDHVPLLQQAYSLPAAMVTRPVAVQAPAVVIRPVVELPAAPVAKAAPGAAAPAGAATDSELLAAFLRGVKSTHQMPSQLTPELMERVGAMLYTATHGTLQLLISRQEFKRVVHSEVTMISAEANNPLKFSPNAEVALAHMLGPRVRGFMGAEDAMNNAYADLRAHQFGVMVGMRAALSHVLGLFTPEQLEKRLSEKSKFDEFFSASRKARLWDQFCKLYTGIAAEAEDNFHTLFGAAFATAYDEQMARFKSEK